jgi:pimeloyl-ACP methyl ester carboxylesterase
MATVDGLHVEVADLPGDRARRAIVLLHEGLGSVGLWRGFPRALHEATGRRVVAFSRLGHGRSDPPRAPRTPAFFHEEANDVLPVLLAELDAPGPLLVGHSDGASIALVHAARHAVSGLALLAPHVFLEETMVPPIRDTRREFEEGGLRARMARHHDDPDAVFYGWCDVWLDPAMGDWSLEPDAAAVSAPILLIQGADDQYASLEHLDRIEARVRGPVTRLVVPGGHSPHLEQAGAVVEAIAGFARSLA